jgi:hypothetical protein
MAVEGASVYEIAKALKVTEAGVRKALAGTGLLDRRKLETAILPVASVVGRVPGADGQADLALAGDTDQAELAQLVRGRLVKTQVDLLTAVGRASEALRRALSEEQPHPQGCQQMSIVLGVLLDQMSKITRELRDLRAASQDDIEVGYSIVERED